MPSIELPSSLPEEIKCPGRRWNVPGAGTGDDAPMHHEPIRPLDCTRLEADARIQGAVLTHLLLAAPAQLSINELLQELVEDLDSFGERDSLLRAVRDLTRSGLLHRHDEFVFPTRSAVHHAALPMG